MRLLLVTKDFPPHIGGIQTWSYELGKRFAPRCEDFALLAPRVAGPLEVDRSAPFEVIRVPCTPGTFVGAVSLGDGPERLRLELLAERLRISHEVRFLGTVAEEALPRVYHLCDIFVHAAAKTRPMWKALGSCCWRRAPAASRW